MSLLGRGDEPSKHALTFSGVVEVALPNDMHTKANCFQPGDRAPISSSVLAELAEPKPTVALGEGGEVTPTVSMPETPMDKDDKAPRLVRNVRASWKASRIDPVADSHTTQDFTDRPFRLGAALSNCPHQAGSFWGCLETEVLVH